MFLQPMKLLLQYVQLCPLTQSIPAVYKIPGSACTYCSVGAPPPLSLSMSLSQCPSPPQVAVANPILHPQHPIYLCRSYHDLSGSLSYSRLAVQYQFSLRDRDSYCHEFNMDMFSQPHPSSARFPDMHL